MPLENISCSLLTPEEKGHVLPYQSMKLEGAAEILPTTGGTEPQDNEVARRIQAAKSEVWESYTALFNWGDHNTALPADSRPRHPDTTH